MSDPTRGAALDLQGLVKLYGGVPAVDDISLKIPAGEFVTLLGPSGSGKTTTLNMISGFTEVDEGEVLMDGESIAKVPPHKRNLGVVFQHYALFPHMTVEENVAFPLKRRKIAKAERSRKIQEALELVHLTGFGDRRPDQLSGGQQQRVALARALVFEPRVLLMDEPLGALDKKLREWLQLEFRRIHQELGITFIYVTHDQEEALVLSDRIAVFNKGRIEQVGRADDLYERPETLFVAEFIGESNCFRGAYSNGGGAGVIRGDEYSLNGPVGDLSEGARAALVVRPERISLRGAANQPAEGDNVMRGVVKQVIYLGSSRKIELAVPGENSLVVSEPAAAGEPLNAGDEVHAYWSPEHSVVLADTEDTAVNESQP
jgi:putative spermidine/putrescine transport system ATP-binding protein